MSKPKQATSFRPMNPGYNAVFQADRLSLGLVVPIETYASGPVPTMDRHLERIQLAEQLGFAAVWLRDVPFQVPSFGDAGQLYDPFVYLGLLAGQTERIALGVASLVLPLRHPAHVAKAAASVDALSGGRLILGVASGDRPQEYPAMHQPFSSRGEQFRESYAYIKAMGAPYPTFESSLGTFTGDIDMLPKPVCGELPLLITGASQQSPEWLASNGDGWMVYPRDPLHLSQTIDRWRAQSIAAGGAAKPVLQPLYVDLADDPDEAPSAIHLGFRLGLHPLLAHLQSLEKIGVNHVALNLRFNRADTEATLKRLAHELLPHFSG